MSLLPSEGESQIGSASMHKVANSNLVFTDLSSFKRLPELEKRVSHAGLYQGIAQTLTKSFHTKQTLANLAAKLVSAADHAYTARRLDMVGCVGQLLLNLPLARQFESIGHYYQALSLNQGGCGDVALAGSLFEHVADNASLRYRARAILALGSTSFVTGDHQTAISFYKEVMKIEKYDRVFDPVTSYFTSRMTAVIRGIEGDHRAATADLQNMFPLVRLASSLQPYVYYDYQNALAVELGEIGRLEEARCASEIALSSKCADAYPNWRETFDDILVKQHRASRSMIAVATGREQALSISSQQSIRTHETVGSQSAVPNKVLRLPAPLTLDAAEPRAQQQQKIKGRVLNFQKWKTMMKEPTTPLPKKLTPQEREEMTTGEKLIRLMDLVSRDETDDATIDRILAAVEEIVLGRKSDIS